MGADVRYEAQVAALPVRGKPGSYSVLLITSRETRRWVVPKGWPMQGLKDCDAAAQEALEEAGVIGRVHKHPIGAYTYDKRQDDGSAIPVRVMVYLLEVEKEINRWREKNERQRDWVTTDEAAARVDEGGLSEMIKRLNVAAIEAMD